jgi:hypothetical protein
MRPTIRRGGRASLGTAMTALAGSKFGGLGPDRVESQSLRESAISSLPRYPAPLRACSRSCSLMILFPIVFSSRWSERAMDPRWIGRMRCSGTQRDWVGLDS